MNFEIPLPLQQEHEQLHAATEEQVMYPAALVVGEFVRRQLARTDEPVVVA